jgi:hypothetical protein
MNRFAMCMLFRVLPLLFCVVMTGCSSVGMTMRAQRLYDPPIQPEEKVARLWTNRGSPVHATAVDGVEVKALNYRDRVIEVLPGKHSARIEDHNGGTVYVEWVAEAGNDYVVSWVSTTLDSNGFQKLKPTIDKADRSKRPKVN